MKKTIAVEPVVPLGVVNLQPKEYGPAINRVVALHGRCDCKVCANSGSRAVCNSCSDFWPCKTIHALRGILQSQAEPTEPTPLI